jgi:three-Cys-motif partner protein
MTERPLSGRARDPNEFLTPFVVDDDGLPVRDGHRWARDKLGILAMYLPAFAVATKRAPARYFVDGLAGEGVSRIAETGELLSGSTLMALKTIPEFSRCISMELDRQKFATLAARTQAFGDRAVVKCGDVNNDLIRAMESAIEHRGAPVLVFLDPEGFEVDWATVVNLSGFRVGAKKVELLMLAMTSQIPRMAAAHDPRSASNRLHWSLPPGTGWMEIADRLAERAMDAEQARREWAQLYETNLRREVGYQFVQVRAITRKGERDSPSVYHLVFASDDETGSKIMAYAFDRMWPDELISAQQPLPGFD